MVEENVMRKIRVSKITINFGAGSDRVKLEKGQKMLKSIFGIEPVLTRSKKRIQNWGLRVGLIIGLKITLRGQSAVDWLKRLLEAKNMTLKASSFDNEGNFSFGIPEYIDIPGVKYNSSLGVLGFEVAVSLERSGFRVKNRRINRAVIPRHHRISHDDAIEYVKSEYDVNII